MNQKELRIVVEQALINAKTTLDQLTDGGKIVRQGSSFGGVQDDTELKADMALGESVRRFLAPFADTVTVEGMDDLKSGNSKYWFCVDPLDASLSYKLRGSTIGLPFSTCVTVLSHESESTVFDDVVAAGIIDLRISDIWVAWKDQNGAYKTMVNGEPACAMAAKRLDLRQTPVIVELYYPENREKVFKAFAGERGWLTNPHSAAYEMALVSSGQAVAYICDRQKQHELGAGFALVKGAGGVVVDFDGKDLGSRIYDFKTQTPVILAVNQEIAEQILEKLK